MIIGCGTGRCGTRSLAEMLDLTHERFQQLRWYYDPQIYQHIFNVLQDDRVGDVGSAWLAYTPQLLNDNPDARVVCLKRDRNETIKSFLKAIARSDTNQFAGDSGLWWWFPQFKRASTEDAVACYYDEYYAIAQQIEKDYENFTIIPTEWLNTNRKEIYDFVGLSEERRDYQSEYKYNQDQHCDIFR